ncbi:MAG: sensor histidine kinase [Oscillospiraceae bacterium]
MKKTSYVLIIRIAAIVLMLAALMAACFGSNQAILSVCLQKEFQGKYSLDNGKTWQTLSESSDIPAKYGSVILKGGFGSGFPDGFHFNFYLDHIAMDVFLNGEQILLDSRTEIGLNCANCRKEWLHWTTPEISENDVLEIRLTNFHRFGNSNAYNEFLDNIYVGFEDNFSTLMLKSGQTDRIIGITLMAAGIMLLAVSLFFGLMNIDGGITTGNLGALALFFGGYIALDTVDLSLWSWFNAFNTYALQICIMLAATCAAACIAESIHSAARKTARAAVIASGAVNGVLALLSIFKIIVIYDTLFFWFAAHIIIYLVLLGCCIYECICKKVTERLAIVSDFLLIGAAAADIICYFSGTPNAGICSKCVFLVLFLIHLVRIIRVIPMNYKAAREAEQLRTELTDRRIATMISQIQPHFIYNTLGSICQLCLEQPEKAAELTQDFSLYLRGNFSELENNRPILLSKELEHVKHYVNIEQVRFPDITVDIDVRSDDFFLPALSVQPLVENAIKHGLMGLESGGSVSICAYETDTEYCVKVSDNGVGFDTTSQPDGKQHIGINNIRERLSAMCGGRLNIDSTPGNGTTAVIYIPKEESK